MLRKIPFNSNLISIGNSPHYNGQLVYSDGHVAYGWQYNIQQPTTGINRATAGLWVAAESNIGHGDSYWCLMDENLNFENVPLRGLPEPHENVYNYYCYPWVCCFWEVFDDPALYRGEMIYSDTNHYEFKGRIVKMNSKGKILTYYDEYDSTLGEYTHIWLCSYNSDGSVVKTDLKSIYNQYDGFRDWYRISASGEDYRGTTITALDTNGGYVTVKTENQDEPYIHFYCANGRCTEASFPAQMVLSNKAKLLLPSLDLIVNGTTYRNDILQLLSASMWPSIGTPANCVHAYNDIVIAQYSNAPDGQNGVMFKNGTLYNYYSFYDREAGEGVHISPQKCWSLAEIPGGQWYINYNPFE